MGWTAKAAPISRPSGGRSDLAVRGCARLCRKRTRAGTSSRAVSPALQRVIEIVTTSLPAPAASVETRLRAEGVTSQLFRLEGIIEIATLLQCKAPFRVTRLKGKRFVVGYDYPRFQDIVSRARRSVRRHGMALLTECLSGDRKARYGQRESALLEEVLSAQKDFRWLDRETGWFWLADVKMKSGGEPHPKNVRGCRLTRDRRHTGGAGKDGRPTRAGRNPAGILPARCRSFRLRATQSEPEPRSVPARCSIRRRGLYSVCYRNTTAACRMRS